MQLPFAHRGAGLRVRNNAVRLFVDPAAIVVDSGKAVVIF